MSIYSSLLVISLISIFQCQGNGPDFRWLSVELINTDFQTDCFNTGCDKPRLELVISRPNTDELKSVSWAVDGKHKSLVNHPGTIFTYVPQGTNITLNCKLTGVDAKYNFPRVCDISPPIHPYPSSNNIGEEQRNVRIELEGDCFNVSAYLSLIRLSDIYPKQRDDVRVAIQPTLKDDNQSVLSATADFPSWVTVALGGAVLVLIVSIIILLIVHFHQKRRRYSHNSSLSSEPRRYSTSQNIFRTESLESKYDIPWDQKFRPLPDWLRSDMTSSHAVTATENGNGDAATLKVTYIGDSGVESA